MITLSHATERVVCLVGPASNLVQQHGRLAGSGTGASTSASTLGLATALLHQLLLRCRKDMAQHSLAQYPVVPALLHATETYMKVIHCLSCLRTKEGNDLHLSQK